MIFVSEEVRLRTRTKSQERKYRSMLKSVNGDKKVANKMYELWINAQAKKETKKENNVAVALTELVNKHFPKDMNLGNKGYAIKRAKGYSGAKGYVVAKIT